MAPDSPAAVHGELERPVAGQPLRAHSHFDAAERAGQPEPAAELEHPVPYILSKMNAPVGQTELLTNADQLKKGIKFSFAQKPAGN